MPSDDLHRGHGLVDSSQDLPCCASVSTAPLVRQDPGRASDDQASEHAGCCKTPFPCGILALLASFERSRLYSVQSIAAGIIVLVVGCGYAGAAEGPGAHSKYWLPGVAESERVTCLALE